MWVGIIIDRSGFQSFFFFFLYNDLKIKFPYSFVGIDEISPNFLNVNSNYLEKIKLGNNLRFISRRNLE